MSSSDVVVPWITRYCQRQDNEYFCEVDEDYIQDKINLIGLTTFPYYRQALDVILDSNFSDDDSDDRNHPLVEEAATLLYGLIHGRYIFTDRGCEKMATKYQYGDFGLCNREYCASQHMLPTSLSQDSAIDKVKLYCPKCQDIYRPTTSRHRDLEGIFFGYGYPEFVFMNYPHIRPLPANEENVPRLNGFKMPPTAYTIQQEEAIAARTCKALNIPSSSDYETDD